MPADDFAPLQLSGPSGASAQLYRHGAHLTSWIPQAGAADRLFLSERTALSPGSAIRGGVPVIFPQFASEGPLPKHGFARNRAWTLIAQQADRLELQLRDDAQTRAIWPQRFTATLAVALDAQRLEIRLSVRNDDRAAFAFTAALHSYLRVDDVGAADVSGLQGLRYRDSAGGGVERIDAPAPLRIDGEVDRIYFDVPGAVELIEPARRTRIETTGFTDVVVWNPGAERGAALADLEEQGYRRMLCIESAQIGRPVQLAPGDSWTGAQILYAR